MPIRNRQHRFNDEETKKAPTEPGAYELLVRSKVVYIGSSSTSIQSRIREHRKRRDFIPVTHFRCQRVTWEDEAIDLEAKLCSAFKKKNGDKPSLQKRTPVNRSIFDW